MANKQKGEVAFEVDGAPYTLRFSTNSLCELEDAVGMGINAIATHLSNPETMRLKTVRAVFWAGLLEHHKVSLTEAGEIVSQLGMVKALEFITKAFTLSFQDAPKARPPKPD